MKKHTVFAGLFLLSVAINAQEVISTQGDSYTNGGNTIDYTIGEPVIETVSDGTNDLTQGFHQTLLTIVGVEDLEVDFMVSIFPNPTAELVNLKIENFSGMTIRLFDLLGKELQNKTLSKINSQISVTDYPKGTYLLTIINEEQKKIKTYKIIKK